MRDWFSSLPVGLQARSSFQFQRISLDELKTICLFLGPYRNLTTLLASILFLHPTCQVLNHGGARIFGKRELDFLADFSEERLQAFARYAIHISETGQRGNHGGSITYSHAFDKSYRTHELFQQASGKRLKGTIQSLVWKESQKTSNRLRENDTDLSAIFKRNDQLRFLLPIRHPIDCAISNLNTGHVSYLAGVTRTSSVQQVVSAILDEFSWVNTLRHNSDPKRFFVLFEHEFNVDVLNRLAQFLKIDPTPEWCTLATAAFTLKHPYKHTKEQISSYRALVENKFETDPAFRDKLLKFVA